MTTNIQILVPVDSVTYTDVQRLELLDFQDLPAWVEDGARVLTRADVCAIPGPTGYDAQWANQLPAETTVARLVDTAVGTLTPQDGTPTILGGRQSILASDNTDIKMLLSANIFPTTGPFWVYYAVHALDSLFMLGGNNSSSQLSLYFVNQEIRFQLNNGGTGLNVATGVTLANRDVIVGFGRLTNGKLRVRYKLRGQAWVETDSPGALTTTVGNSFAFGANYVLSTYSPWGYWGSMLFADQDLTPEIQGDIESYLANYYDM